jgi:hypothetical protein
MINRIWHLTIYSHLRAKAYSVRSQIRTFVNKHSGCKVISCGRSCIDPACTDIEVRVRSRSSAAQLIAAIRKTYSDCEIEADIVA